MELIESKYQTLMNDLQGEGKLHSLDEVLNLDIIEQINTRMEAVRRDYRLKDAESKQEAALVILNS